MADQLLNIRFTGDVSELDRAINEALKDLTSFENKVKGISTLDFSKLVSEIDSIRGKFSTLEVKVDSQKALTELTKITSQLSGVKDVLIDVDINDAEVKAQIDSIAQRISAIDLGTLTFPDIQGATSEINQILGQLAKLKTTDVLLDVDNSAALGKIKQVESSLESVRGDIELSFDSTRINQAIQDVRTKFTALGELDIKADPSGALTAINRILNAIGAIKSSEILLDADNSEALSSINEIQSKLLGIKSDIEITVDADIEGTINDIRSKFQTLAAIDIKANPAQALAAIDTVLADIEKIKSSEVFLKANNSQALASIEQLETKFKNLKVEFTPVVSPLDTTKLQSLTAPFTKAVELNLSTKAAEVEINNLLQIVNNLKGKDILINVNGTEVVRTVDQIEKELLQLQVALKKATDPKDVARLNQALVTLKGSLSGSAFNQFSKSSNSATFALTNLGRVAQDSSFGFIGIANNLNPLLESFQRLRAEAGSSGRALKLLGSSLIGAGGLGLALSAVTAILQFSQLGFSAWTRGLDGAGKKADETAEKIKRINDLIRSVPDIKFGAIGGTQDEILRVQVLASAVKDVSLSYKERNRALEELKSINQAYFGDLTLEASKLGALQIAVENYTAALTANAVQKAFLDDIGAVSKELAIQGGILKALNDSYDRQFGIALRATDANQRASEQEIKTKRDLKKQIADQTALVFQLGSQYDVLQEQVKNAILESLKFKSPTIDTKGIKDATDDIIERAKLLRKELEVAFVVPDLEITFFKNKGAVLKDAKQLLDDFAKGNLKIKLPVLADIEFLPESIPLAQSVIDDFFKDVAAQREIPVTVTPDITLAKGSLDKIEEKLKLRQGFSIFGDLGFKEFNKIDFSNINKGIQEASKTLQGMLEIANTLNQSIGQGLVGAFNAAFDAALEGKNVFKALGEALKQLIIGTIKAIAQMLILKAVTSFIFPGLAAGGGFPFQIPGRGGLSAAPGFIGGIGGGRSAPSLVATVRGTDLQFVLSQGANQIGRVG